MVILVDISPSASLQEKLQPISYMPIKIDTKGELWHIINFIIANLCNSYIPSAREVFNLKVKGA